MKQVTFAVLLLISIAACMPTASNSDVTPAFTPVMTSTAPVENSIPASPTSIVPPNTSAAVASSLYLPYLKMIDVHQGWAVVQSWGNHILRTKDGGTTWQDVTPPQLFTMQVDPSYFHSFFGDFVALDANTAWIATAGETKLSAVIWRTEDGGLSWQPGNPIQVYREGPAGGINGFEPRLQFVNAKDGWLRARVNIVMGRYFDTWFHTADGGLTWTRLPIGCNDYASCNYFFIDQTTGFKDPFDEVFVTSGEPSTNQQWRIERTLDGGATWSDILLARPDVSSTSFFAQELQPLRTSQSAIRRQNFAQFGFGALGLRIAFFVNSAMQPQIDKGYYYISYDKGETWQSFPFSGDLFFLTDATGWRFSWQEGKYLLEKTTDAGVTWHSVGKERSEIGLLQFADENTGWMMTYFAGNRVFATSDGGQTWKEITTNLSQALLPAPLVGPPSIGSIPTDPAIARMDAGSPLVLHDIDMFDANHGWGVSLSGYVFRTSDGGKSWQDVTPQYGIGMDHDFFALDALHAWRVVRPPQNCFMQNFADQCPDYYARRGPVWSTTDGGQTWNPGGAFPDLARTFDRESIAIRFANEALGWAQWYSADPNQSGALYHLIKTTDGGRTWTPVVAEHHQGDKLFLNEQVGFQASTPWPHTLANLMDGSALQVLQKTVDGGMTWQPISLPKFTVNLDDPDLEDNASLYPAYCAYSDVNFFGTKGIAIKVFCTLDDTQNLPWLQFFEYYYSADKGQTWNNWVSFEYEYSSENQHAPGWEEWRSAAGEFFLDAGIGWRLYKPGPHTLADIQRTVDGGNSWETVNTVAWQEADFSFINEQEGWVTAANGDAVALLHTVDGGKTWEEMKPIVTSK